MYKLIALDIDDTITQMPCEVPEEIISAVRRAKEAGIHVTVATGRGWLGSKMIMDSLDITEPVINYGGAMINDPKTGSRLHSVEIPPELVSALLKDAAAGGIHVQLYQGDTVITEKQDGYIDAYVQKLCLPYEYDAEITSREWHGVPKVLMMTSIDEAKRLIPEYRERYRGRLKVSGSGRGLIEFNHPEAHKGTGLEWIASRLGIAQCDTVAAGDNTLDIEMIRWAGLGCAVDNAVPEVKEAADMVIPSCAEHGVARLVDCIINERI